MKQVTFPVTLEFNTCNNDTAFCVFCGRTCDLYDDCCPNEEDMDHPPFTLVSIVAAVVAGLVRGSNNGS